MQKYRKQQKTENIGERDRKKNTQKQPTFTMKTVNKIIHMKFHLRVHQTVKEIQKTMISKNIYIYITLKTQETSLQKNIIQSSAEKHTGYDTRANNSKRPGNKKSVVILGGGMTTMLNGSEIAKKIQSNCKSRNIFQSNGFM